MKNTHTARSTRGASLVVALVILLVMTIVGVASMNSSTLQERMTSNERQRSLALNAAEFALRAAETYLTNNVRSTENLNDFNGANGLYAAMPLPTNGAVSALGDIDLSDDDNWAALGSEAPGLSTEVAAKAPKYIIEYVGRGNLSSASNTANVLNVDTGSVDFSPFYFRITAIGWGRDDKIYSVIESNFRTGYGDDFFIY